jgi:hypothetical protein
MIHYWEYAFVLFFSGQLGVFLKNEPIKLLCKRAICENGRKHLNKDSYATVLNIPLY